MHDTRVATTQFAHRPGDMAYNLGRIKALSRQARERGAELVLNPEMCLTGYWHLRHLSEAELRELSREIPDADVCRDVLELSAELGLCIGFGLIERASDGALYNSYVVAMPDGRFAKHRKLHCFISEHLKSGSDIDVFELPNGNKAAILTCYDNNIVENVRLAALAGAEIILAPHQTGGCETGCPGVMGRIEPRLWHEREQDPVSIEQAIRGPKGRAWLLRWLPARAHDNGVFYVFSNGVGVDDNEVRTGNAMILDPNGEILTESWSAEDDLIVADLQAVRYEQCLARRWMRSRRPELYAPLTRPTGDEVDIRTARFAGLSDS